MNAHVLRHATVLCCATVLSLLAGCMPSMEDQVKKSPNSIMKKTTQEVGKYDPATMKEVGEDEEQATNPVTGPLELYGPIVGDMAKTTIDMRLAAYNAEHNSYPNYEEFMAQIIKGSDPVQLPVLPGKKRYMYDEANHKLVVVHPAEDAPAGAAPVEPAKDPAPAAASPY